MSKVIYAGSFDPITLGHIDIIHRAKEIFGSVIVAVLKNNNKKSLFTIEERMELIREVLGDEENIEVDSFEGLLVDYAAQKGCRTVIRGIRSASDYENEYMMALANQNYKEGIETVFLLTSHQYQFVSSSLTKEVATFQGDTSLFVPPVVGKALEEKLGGEE